MAAVFVYGTLKEGYSNYERVLQPFVERGECELVSNSARLADRSAKMFVDYYYCPYLLMRNTGDEINQDRPPMTGGEIMNERDSLPCGELYTVSPEALEKLDELEGVQAGRYKRILVE